MASYEYLRDTFGLPDTLTAITQSGGRHYVFRLPDDLPAGWLKSWIRVVDKIALPGIDLKVGNCGLMFAEPTRGAKGVYRWIDPTVPPATLPREACDFLREIRYKDGGRGQSCGLAVAARFPKGSIKILPRRATRRQARAITRYRRGDQVRDTRRRCGNR